MPIPILDEVELASRRGGPGFDYECQDPTMIECAAYECQHRNRCRMGASAVAPRSSKPVIHLGGQHFIKDQKS